MTGVVQILRYNWLTYASVVVLSVVGLGIAGRVSSLMIAWALTIAAIAALAGTTISLVASWWIYDRSPLRRWEWLRGFVGAPPPRWVNIHTGLDEVTAVLARLFPTDAPRAIDLFGALPNPSASISRARLMRPPAVVATAGRPEALPLASGSVDAIFLVFAAHEVRQRDLRVQLFRETARVLAEGGRVVMVEHLRDLPNMLVFGPGALHFIARREWLQNAEAGGLRLATERSVTPFVRAMLFERT